MSAPKVKVPTFIPKDQRKKYIELVRQVERFEVDFKDSQERLREGRKTGMTMQDSIELIDEVRTARDDLGYVRKLLTDFVASYDPSNSEDARKEREAAEEARCRALPKYQHEKRKLEAARGSEMTWPEFWAWKDAQDRDREEFEDMSMRDRIRGYGWDFDAGNSGAVFSSDQGSHQYSVTVLREDNQRFAIEVAKQNPKRRAAPAADKPKNWNGPEGTER